MFLRNYWYVAASAPEIGRKPFRRIIMNEPVVFYRTEDGTPVALEDRCPHRRLPLSMGRWSKTTCCNATITARFDRTSAVCACPPGHDRRPRGWLSVVERYSGCGSGWAIRRSPTRRSPLSLARRPGLGRQDRLSLRPVQLAARQRQPARLAPGLCTGPPSATWRWWSTRRCGCSARRPACR
jgi:nitrite reductase/ring-hydroxylating ferredoxin subunit